MSMVSQQNQAGISLGEIDRVIAGTHHDPHSILGAERPGQVPVYLGGGLAEPVGLAGEVAAGLGRADPALGRVEVPHAGRRERPAVRGGPQVAGQDAQDDRGPVQPGLDPAQRLGYVGGTAHGQGPGHLQVRVGARGGPAEHLKDAGFAEHQAGVALLAGQHQAVQAGIDLGARLVREAQRPRPAAVGDGLEQQPGQVRVVQRVVGHPPVVGHPDQHMPQVVWHFLPQPEEELVGVHHAALDQGAARRVRAG